MTTCLADADFNVREELLDEIDGLEFAAARHLTAERDLDSVVKSGDVSDADYEALDAEAFEAQEDFFDAAKPERLLYLVRLFRSVVGGDD